MSVTFSFFLVTSFSVYCSKKLFGRSKRLFHHFHDVLLIHNHSQVALHPQTANYIIDDIVAQHQSKYVLYLSKTFKGAYSTVF